MQVRLQCKYINLIECDCCLLDYCCSVFCSAEETTEGEGAAVAAAAAPEESDAFSSCLPRLEARSGEEEEGVDEREVREGTGEVG